MKDNFYYNKMDDDYMNYFEQYIYQNNSLLIDFMDSDKFIDFYENNRVDDLISHLAYAEYLIINNICVDLGYNIIRYLIKNKTGLAIKSLYLIYRNIDEEKSLKILKKYKNKYPGIDKIYATLQKDTNKSLNIFKKYDDIFSLVEILKIYVHLNDHVKIDEYFNMIKNHKHFKYLLNEQSFSDFICTNIHHDISFNYFNMLYDNFKLPNITFHLAKHYIYGYGVKKDIEKGRQLLIECKNYIPSLIELGNLYESGLIHSKQSDFKIILDELIKNYHPDIQNIIHQNLSRINGNNTNHILHNIEKNINININQKKHLTNILRSLINLYDIDYASAIVCYSNISEKDEYRIFHILLDKIGLECSC